MNPRLHEISGLAAALLVAAMSASAQTAAGRPDPGDPAAVTPAPRPYRSLLSQYRRLDEARSTPWREANDAVERIGGWRAYAREANAPEPGASAPVTPAPAPAPAPARATRPATPPAPHRH